MWFINPTLIRHERQENSTASLQQQEGNFKLNPPESTSLVWVLSRDTLQSETTAAEEGQNSHVFKNNDKSIESWRYKPNINNVLLTKTSQHNRAATIRRSIDLLSTIKLTTNDFDKSFNHWENKKSELSDFSFCEYFVGDSNMNICLLCTNKASENDRQIHQ